MIPYLGLPFVFLKPIVLRTLLSMQMAQTGETVLITNYMDAVWRDNSLTAIVLY